VVILQPLAAGVVAGILSNITGYLITGRLFHPYQAQTPNTWRAAPWTIAMLPFPIRQLVPACGQVATLVRGRASMKLTP